MSPEIESNAKKLDYVAYANLAAGTLSFVLWALPGPWAVQTMWQLMDQMQSRHGDSGPTVMITVMKGGILVVVILFWLFSAVSVVNGYLILKRRRYGTCFALPIISIFGTLFGVVVGVVSLAILGQDWARALFTSSSEPIATDSP